MRFLFTFIKEVAIAVDGLWLDNAGHEIVFYDPTVGKNKTIYGFYDMPTASSQQFGIDSLDDMQVQINRDVFKQYANFLGCGAKLKIENGTWVINHRCQIYNRFLGQYRTELNVQRHCESNAPEGE